MEDPSNQINDESKTTVSEVTEINKKTIKPLRIIIPIIAVVFAVFLLFSFISRPFDKTDNKYSNITIEQGETLKEVSEKLEDSGIISSASNFRLVSKCLFLTDFKPGTYYLSPSMDARALATAMVNGLTTSKGFTIPPGYTVEQIAAALDRDGLVDHDQFIEAASSSFFQELDFVGNSISGIDQLEGFMLPDEYNMNSNADEAMIIMTMLDNFNNFFNEDYRARADELNLSIRDIVVIASMIETNITIEKERSTYSSVIHNDLNMGIIKKSDFPAVPLCSPGKDSIMAALYPDESEYTYCVFSDKLDGSHVFTSDKKEYKELKKAYKAAVKERDEARQKDSAEDSDAESPDTESEEN